MANVSLDEYVEWLDELNPQVVSHFRSTGGSTSEITDLHPTVQLYFFPSGGTPRENYEPPEEPEEGGEGGGGTPVYPYF